MAELLTQSQESVVDEGPVDRLVAYLRAHPYKLDHSKAELAEQFGLHEEFVADVLETLKGSPNKLAKSESVLKAFTMTMRSWGANLSKLYDEFTERPMLAVFVTLVLTVAVMLLMRHAGTIGLLPVSEEQVPQTVQNTGLILGGTLVLLHALTYFRHGMMRYAIYGTGIVFAVSVSTMQYLGGGRAIPIGPDQVIAAENSTAFLFFAGFALSMFYFMFATVVSLAGGYWKSNQADQVQRRMSRQELLDQLFVLQERLRDLNFDPASRRRQSMFAVLRSTAWLPVIALATGFAVGLVSVVLRGAFAQPNLPVEEASQIMPGVVRFATQTLTALVFGGLGYLSGGVRRCVIAFMLMYAGTLAAELTPYSYFGPGYIEFLKSSGLLLEGMLNTLLLSVLVGVGAHIDKRARVRQKLQQNDPAHVTAEIVEIQWRLNPTTDAMCVMMVDVAGSTRMKAEADPLAVEYSFRAYHVFIAGISQRRGGTVLTTAGDGAIVTFASCGEALYAAKEIQTKFAQFNAQTNRLPSPFRVRIGIHTGVVSAQLHDAPFNELIDIAAHVEKVAPVGGIALTQSVVEDLADERVAALKDQVDGQNVYLVLNPTMAL